MAVKNDWVLIKRTILEPAGRAPTVPDDTKKVALEMWVKGYLINEKAEIGDEVEVKTITGRVDYGRLEEVGPHYVINYGDFVPEILRIGADAKKILFGGEDNE